MKKVLFIAFMMVSGLALQAQEGFRAGINLAIPTGDASDVSGFSIGLDATYLWNVAESFDVGVAAGFTNAFGKEIEVDGIGSFEVDDVQFLPIAAAARYHVTDKFRVGGDIGYAIGISDGNDGGFYYRPMVGYGLNEKMELNLSYTGISLDGGNWSTIGLGFMYAF
jgi:hypothetical protein